MTPSPNRPEIAVSPGPINARSVEQTWPERQEWLERGGYTDITDGGSFGSLLRQAAGESCQKCEQVGLDLHVYAHLTGKWVAYTVCPSCGYWTAS